MGKGAGTTRNSSAASPNGVGMGGSNSANIDAYSIPPSNIDKSQWDNQAAKAETVFDKMLELAKENQGKDNQHDNLSFDNIKYYLNKVGVKSYNLPTEISMKGTEDEPIRDEWQGIRFKIAGSEYKLMRNIYGWGGSGTLRMAANGKMKSFQKTNSPFESFSWHDDEKITTTIEKLKYTAKRLWKENTL